MSLEKRLTTLERKHGNSADSIRVIIRSLVSSDVDGDLSGELSSAAVLTGPFADSVDLIRENGEDSETFEQRVEAQAARNHG